ncbi:MAG: dockerin type I repeat-containing protein [bacterium]
MRLMWTLLVVLLLLTPAVSASADDLCGDVNNDGLTLTVADIALLSRYLAGETELAVSGNADVNLCGEVNVADLSRYLAYFAWGMPWQICVAPPECVLPTGANQVELGCPLIIFPDYLDSVAIPVYFTNDQQLLGMSLGFHWNANSLRITSIDLDGSVIPAGHNVALFSARDPNYLWADADSNYVMLLVSQDISEPGEFIEPQSGGLLARLWVNVEPGTPSQAVDFDSAFFAPAGEFAFAPAAGGIIVPAYVDCGSEDIVISRLCGPDPYIHCKPGDFNADGMVNITDVVGQISYIFDSGPPPRPWTICSGDANGDCVSGILDAIYIIQYIFSNGPTPETCLQFSDFGCNPGSYDPGPWD